MKTTDRRKFGVERKLKYRNFIHFADEDEAKRINNQRFIVPWQMMETEKSKYLVE